MNGKLVSLDNYSSHNKANSKHIITMLSIAGQRTREHPLLALHRTPSTPTRKGFHPRCRTQHPKVRHRPDMLWPPWARRPAFLHPGGHPWWGIFPRMWNGRKAIMIVIIRRVFPIMKIVITPREGCESPSLRPRYHRRRSRDSECRPATPAWHAAPPRIFAPRSAPDPGGGPPQNPSHPLPYLSTPLLPVGAKYFRHRSRDKWSQFGHFPMRYSRWFRNFPAIWTDPRRSGGTAGAPMRQGFWGGAVGGRPGGIVKGLGADGGGDRGASGVGAWRGVEIHERVTDALDATNQFHRGTSHL